MKPTYIIKVYQNKIILRDGNNKKIPETDCRIKAEWECIYPVNFVGERHYKDSEGNNINPGNDKLIITITENRNFKKKEGKI